MFAEFMQKILTQKITQFLPFYTVIVFESSTIGHCIRDWYMMVVRAVLHKNTKIEFIVTEITRTACQSNGRNAKSPFAGLTGTNFLLMCLAASAAYR